MTKPVLHNPVLLNEAINALAVKPTGNYVDATFGRGGHSKAILAELASTGRLLVMDKDPAAIAEARALNDQRVLIWHGSYASIDAFAAAESLLGAIDGILLDCGVSSPQLDQAERGFSFLHDGPLDMRMDNSQGMTVAEWLAQVKATELAGVFKTFGEERYAKRIANAIVAARHQAAIVRTTQLASIIKQAHPRWEPEKHPATRCFQALRIYINRELDDLTHCLQASLACLRRGGRLAVISFHSLEDRMVKRFMRQQATRNDIPISVPLPHHLVQPNMRLVGKAIKPTTAEIASNQRARSAVLRVGEKCHVTD